MRRRSPGAALAALLAATTAGAQGPPAASATSQQLFDSAIALEAKGDHAAALAAWELLEARAAKNRRTVAIARLHKGAMLLRLDRSDEAVAAARAGLADLPASDATLQEDRYRGNVTLGRVAEGTLDYASAVDSYRTAAGLASTPTYKLAALRGLIATETFVDPEAVATDLATAMAVLETVKADNASRATFLRLASELALNRKDYAGARRQAEAAVNKLGGLTTNRMDLNDVAARSDYALASMLLDKPDDARRYMAYTGAGRLPKGQFDPAAEMKVPECGGEARLRAEDAAVVEFSIAPDGSVLLATPIWSAGGGAAALEFARTARGWSFAPEKVKAMPEFFRYRARVEMRCSTGFERPSLGSYFNAALIGWLRDRKVAGAVPRGVSDAVAATQLRARLAAEPADTIASVPVMMALLANSVVPREEKNALGRRALSILDKNGAPPAVRLAIERIVWETNSARRWDVNYSRDALAAVEAPFYQSDPQTRAAVRLLAADALRPEAARVLPLLQAAADEPGLPANHPLRVGALIRIAAIENNRGNADAARTAFERTGLSASQCALLDAPPKLVKSNVSSSDFPMEAMRWGFEGWSQLQYDIRADGKVSGERVLISYPPFVFSQAAKDVAGGLSYAKSYRPDGGLGCGGTTNRVRFSRPS